MRQKAPTFAESTDIRNVVLVGHAAAGKTTLIEHLLAATGTISRAGTIVDGTTVTDSDPAAIKQQRSIALSLAPLTWENVKINLLDTPGYGDFAGEVRAGLRAADAALFVVSAVDGVDATTIALWEECAAVDMPRAIAVTRLDHARADFDETVAICQRAFGSEVLPLYLPVHDDTAEGHPVVAVIDLLSQQIIDYRGGAFPPSRHEPEQEHRALIETPRSALIEAIIAESEDETLLDRYLAGELGKTESDFNLLTADLERAVARASFYPAIPVAATMSVGLAEVLELFIHGFPTPAERKPPAVSKLDGTPVDLVSKVAADPNGPLVAEVVKTTLDSYVGRVCLVRVFSGTLQPDTAIHVSGHGLEDRGHTDHDEDEKVSHLYSPLGSSLREVPVCVAGDLCALTKIPVAETGDTISAKDQPLLIDPWEMPEPLLPIAVVARSRSDEDALAKNLARLISGDATLRLERNADTGQLVLWCMGEAHADVVLDRLRAGGVELDTEPVKVAFRETFIAHSTGRGRYVKQSGGHGQFGICDITVEPLPTGAGFEFVSRIVGGVIPHQYVLSVKKGIRAQLSRGLRAGFPVVDLKVTLIDGKTHSVDSSDAAFQQAGALALRDAASNGKLTVLEPIDEVEIRVPDGYVGPVMSDISTRRGRVLGTEADDGARAVIRAEIPAQELTTYATQLRSLTSGTAVFSREFRQYEPMPQHLVDKISASD